MAHRVREAVASDDLSPFGNNGGAVSCRKALIDSTVAESDHYPTIREEWGMAGYWISFRIDTEFGDYAERYDDLMEAIKGNASRWWDDTTSFLAFETPDNIDRIMAKVISAIDEEHDIALVRAMDSKDAQIYGVIEDQDIFQIMPYLKYAE